MNFEAYGRVESRKMRKFVLRAASRPNQIECFTQPGSRRAAPTTWPTGQVHPQTADPFEWSAHSGRAKTRHEFARPSAKAIIRHGLAETSRRDLLGDHLEARERARAERGLDRNVGGVVPPCDQNATDARLVVTGIESVPAAAPPAGPRSHKPSSFQTF